MGIYRHIVRPLLFRCDPEAMHHAALRASGVAGKLPPARAALDRLTRVDDPRLHTELAGMHFANPIGLAPGYDKSAVAVDGLAALGFGHIEIGSVSIDPSAGNPKPRLFRLPEDEAIVVHYGLNNDGARVVADRLRARRTRTPVGVNIVKTNRGIDAPPEPADAILREYVDAVRLLAPVADYLTLNLSCPNTETGRDFFQEPGHTRRLMDGLRDEAIDRPVFLKVSPLGGDAALDRTLEAVDDAPFVSGFIFNLAPWAPEAPGDPEGHAIDPSLRTPESRRRRMRGSLAGRPVERPLNDRIASLYRRMDRSRYAIIGVGGVFDADDAYRKIRLGASLVQLLTGLVYEGPMLVRHICRGLAQRLERDGFRSVSEAVGADR